MEKPIEKIYKVKTQAFPILLLRGLTGMTELRIPEKYALTIEEAAEYFHLGTKHLRQLIKRDPNVNWVLWNGTHATIKRRLFEEMLDTTNAI